MNGDDKAVAKSIKELTGKPHERIRRVVRVRLERANGRGDLLVIFPSGRLYVATPIKQTESVADALRRIR